MNKIIRAYSYFVSHYPYIILALVALISIVAFNFASNVGSESMDNRDTLPDTIDVIRAFNIIEDNFGGSESILISIEINPMYPNSNEIRDIRHPDVIIYSYLLAEMSSKIENVESASSAGTLFRDINSNNDPKSLREVIDKIEGNNMFFDYISSDYEMSLIRITLSGDYDPETIVEELQQIIKEVKQPAGLNVNVAGDVATGPIITNYIGPDMARTSQFSIVGILLVLFLVFMSFRYAIKPLFVIGFGVLWTFGFLGLMNMSLSPATSGAISMIMGIGIDFGIQIIMRFRHELKNNVAYKAMEITMQSVLLPMFTTTVAALIGFQAMSLGELTVLQDLGEIMSYGVLFCFFAAITIVPVISILGENLFSSIKKQFKLGGN
ncbi:MAG: MMPL family transporter [Candidatus Woesearchaeota archaeon]